MISHVHRCIFIHIPRTGGSSIESVIWPQEHRTEADLWMGFTSPDGNKYQTGGLQHLLARQIRDEVGAQTFTSYFKFAIVRDPFDKAVSQYAYMRERPDLRAFIGMQEHDSFERYLELIQRRTHVQWQAQRDFLVDEHGKLIVDFLGRFDRLEIDAATIFERLGITAKLPHLNASQRGAARSYYDARTISRVETLYRDDIMLFDPQKI